MKKILGPICYFFALVILNPFIGLGKTNTLITQKTKKIALLVGINKYHWSNNTTFQNLNGSINDVKAIQKILINRFGFLPTNIRTLTDGEATHDRIISEFRSFLVNRVDSGDIVVFYFSGHGSRISDDNGDEADQFDETLVPYDSRDSKGKIFDIRDDDIYKFLVELYQKGAYIMLFIDSCHSGSAMRIGRSNARARWIPTDLRKENREREGGVVKYVGDGRNGFLPDLPNYIAITATTDQSKAYEIEKDGEFFGAFSLALLNALGNLPKDVSYRELMNSIRNQMQITMPSQKPQFEGDIYGKLFDGKLPVREYVLNASKVSERKVAIDAGSIQNITEGSVFYLYKKGRAGGMESNNLLGKVIITKVFADNAIGDLVESKGNFIEADAVEVEHNYEDMKIKIRFDHINNPSFMRISNAIKGMQVVQTVKQTGYYDLRIYTDNQMIIMENFDGVEFVEGIYLSNPNAAEQIMERIQKRAKYQAIESLSNYKSRLNARINVVQIETNQDGTYLEKPQKKFTQNGEIIVHPGQRIFFEITNESPYGQSFFVYIFYLGMDYKVQLIYPPLGATNNLLKNGQKVRTPSGIVGEKLNRRDIIKIIVTTKPVNVAVLQQTSIDRKVFTSKLEYLLHEAYTGTRRGEKNILPLLDWGTNSIATYTIER
jgi:hypothetical protein